MRREITKLAGLAVIALCSFSQGCSHFTEPMKLPVTQNQVLNVGTLSMIASRRAVYVVGKKVQLNPGEKTFKFESQFCAEPPPDVTENIVSSITGNFEGSGKAETKAEIARLEAQAKADFAKALSTNGSAISRRTQGAQYLRDSLYNLCQAYLNGAISELEYKAQATTVLQNSAKLIEIELPLMYDLLKAERVNKSETPLSIN